MDKIFFESLDNFALNATISALNVDTDKSLIAVIVAQDDLSPTQNNSFELAQEVKRGVIESGFDAKIYFAPTFPCVVNENRCNLQLRENTAEYVQRIADSCVVDGFVFVASNLYSVFGMLKGALDSNLPCIFISNGCMNPVVIDSTKYGLTALNGISALSRAGKIRPAIYNEAITAIEEQLGNDSLCYESNCGALLIQALGLALPHSVGVLANSVAQKKYARKTGSIICQLAERRLAPDKMITFESLKMALAVDIAIGGSANAFINIAWLAKAIGEEINFKTLEKIADIIPRFCLPREDFDVRNFDESGGVFSVIKTICQLNLPLEANYLCYNNEKMVDFCKNFSIVPTLDGITPKERQKNISVKILSGNIANSAISYNGDGSNFVGIARIFYSEESLVDAILNNKIKTDDCIILPYCGAKGGLFMPVKSTSMLKAIGLSRQIAIVTDGIIPHFYDGLAISLVNAEAYDESTFAFIKEGDKIEINLLKGKLNLDVNAKEIKIRRKQMEVKRILQSDKNYYFSKCLSSPEEGCVLKYSFK